MVKNLPANAGDIRDVGLIPRLGRSPGEGHNNPLQYSCLGNPMDRVAWWATVHGITKSQTQLSNLAAAAAANFFIHSCISQENSFFSLSLLIYFLWEARDCACH